MIPVAPGIPATTPRAENRASSVPSRTRTRAPQAASMSMTRRGPFRASRTAAVAMSSVSPTPSDSARRAKRVTVPVASCIASPSRSAPDASPRPERAEHPLVVEGDEGILQPVEDHEPDGVGADVDDGHRTGVRGARGRDGGGLHQARAGLLLVRRLPRAAPRPDRLGWVMKVLVGGERLLAAGSQAGVGPVRLEPPGLRLVREVRPNDPLDEPGGAGSDSRWAPGSRRAGQGFGASSPRRR